MNVYITSSDASSTQNCFKALVDCTRVCPSQSSSSSSLSSSSSHSIFPSMNFLLTTFLSWYKSSSFFVRRVEAVPSKRSSYSSRPCHLLPFQMGLKMLLRHAVRNPALEECSSRYFFEERRRLIPPCFMSFALDKEMLGMAGTMSSLLVTRRDRRNPCRSRF